MMIKKGWENITHLINYRRLPLTEAGDLFIIYTTSTEDTLPKSGLHPPKLGFINSWIVVNFTFHIYFK